MANIKTLHHALNVGVVDTDKLHRVDLERMRLAAERQTNLIPDTIGKAFVRPGFQFKADLGGPVRPIPFLVDNERSGLLLFGPSTLRIHDRFNEAFVGEVIVSSDDSPLEVPSGNFSASTGWTLSSASGQTTQITSGQLRMSARGRGAKANASCQVTVDVDSLFIARFLHIHVDCGPVEFFAGSSSTSDDYIRMTTLDTGHHYLEITPQSDFYIVFQCEGPTQRRIESCEFTSAGELVIETPYQESDLDKIRVAQSLDVMYIACEGYREMKVERRYNFTAESTSWSLTNYDRDDGPFEADRRKGSANKRRTAVKLTPSVLNGRGTLTASESFFLEEHVGSLFRLFHERVSGVDTIDEYLCAANESTSAFMVSGITESNFEERKFTWIISGTWVGTIRLMRSFNGEFGDYHEFRREQASSTIDVTANATYVNDDNDDNLDVWVKAVMTSYTSGEARIRFQYQGGGGYGICRVLAYTDAQTVDMEVLTPFKRAAATAQWRASRYDGEVGYPSAVGFVDGRLAWGGDELIDASVSDAYESFNEDFDGDAGPISRSIALEGRSKIRWMKALTSLILGCNVRVANARASSLDEIVTPNNFGIKSLGKVGAAAIDPVEIGEDGLLFASASRHMLYELAWSGERGRYIASPFAQLNEQLLGSGEDGIKSMAAQTQPNQRFWVTVDNGEAFCILYEPGQNVLPCYIPIKTGRGAGAGDSNDTIQYFAVLPSDDQDLVYAVIKRGEDYFFELMALDSQAKISEDTRNLDSWVEYLGVVQGDNPNPTWLEGLEHLEGREVAVWIDGAPLIDETIDDPALDNTALFTVTDGAIDIGFNREDQVAVVGLQVEWEYKSARLAYGVQGYSPMLQNKSLAAAGLLLSDYSRSGIKYGVVNGAGFDTPWNLPQLAASTGAAAEELVSGDGEDEHPFPLDGWYGLDTRLCLSGASPKPVTIRAIVLDIATP